MNWTLISGNYAKHHRPIELVVAMDRLRTVLLKLRAYR